MIPLHSYTNPYRIVQDTKRNIRKTRSHDNNNNNYYRKILTTRMAIFYNPTEARSTLSFNTKFADFVWVHGSRLCSIEFTEPPTNHSICVREGLSLCPPRSVCDLRELKVHQRLWRKRLCASVISVGEKKQVISVLGYKGISDHIGRIWGT